ncbi:TMEM222 protein [Hibiscus syriacus]|uniref:TMEM222 protein n=1 Tax=Hibiscus syriacus TaxID=106335 RepID=A0A6A3A7L2_HIBSY|nr:uncharacterized protein LOC120131931 [Hibiscus syriacus]KAE8700390.1 TMEM222 protein [Hibiscus syriacus]
MADKPSRGLIIYGDGLARLIQPSHTHLHSLASIANCGFLSLPNSPPSESEDDRIVREFAVLVDAFEALNKNGQFASESKSQESSLIPSISERFMGMKAAVLSNNSSLKSFGEKFGFDVLNVNGLLGNSNTPPGSSVDSLTSELLSLLGFQEGKIMESNQFDLVIFHVGSGENLNVESSDAAASDVEFMNALLGAIMSIATPGTEVGSRLLLSLVMSYGYVSNADDPGLSILSTKDEKNPHLSVLFPKQSYTMRGENPRNDVRHHSPMLFAQYQYAVTRKDMVETFSFEDFKERSGNLSIPADRMLHEVAFKLWKAPKYGA